MLAIDLISEFGSNATSMSCLMFKKVPFHICIECTGVTIAIRFKYEISYFSITISSEFGSISTCSIWSQYEKASSQICVASA